MTVSVGTTRAEDRYPTDRLPTRPAAGTGPTASDASVGGAQSGQNGLVEPFAAPAPRLRHVAAREIVPIGR